MPSTIGKGLFGAEQLSVPVNLTVEEEIVRKQRQYKSLLDINGEQWSGPFTELENNWIGEEKGMEKWPPIFQIQIAEFIHAILANIFLVIAKRQPREDARLRGGNPIEP